MALKLLVNKTITNKNYLANWIRSNKTSELYQKENSPFLTDNYNQMFFSKGVRALVIKTKSTVKTGDSN